MNEVHPVVIGTAVMLGVPLMFLALREVMCWYWKINEALVALKDMQAVLRNIDRHVAADFAEKRKPEDAWSEPR